MSDILISIHQRHVAKILGGSKTFELRRKFHTKHEKARVWIYETSPTCSVVATAWVQCVVEWAIEPMWMVFKDRIGVTRDEYDAYFSGCEFGFAVQLRSPQKLPTPITLTEMRAAGIQPPQSYRTVPAEILRQWEAR